MGGMTTTTSGTANQEGYSGTKEQEELEPSGNPRTKQGYSAGRDDHDYNVGA